MSLVDFDALPMIRTHCPICLAGPRFDCSDMKRCPLVQAKFHGRFISPEEFAIQHGVQYECPVEPNPVKHHPETSFEPPAVRNVDGGGQFSLF